MKGSSVYHQYSAMTHTCCCRSCNSSRRSGVGGLGGEDLPRGERRSDRGGCGCEHAGYHRHSPGVESLCVRVQWLIDELGAKSKNSNRVISSQISGTV